MTRGKQADKCEQRPATTVHATTRWASIGAAIQAVGQEVTALEEACYEALREARDASRRAANLQVQALEAKVRLHALVECEHTGVRTESKETTHPLCPVIMRLARMYFDEGDKYRLVLVAKATSTRQEGQEGQEEEEAEPIWYSRVLFDGARPESRASVAAEDAVRAAYRAAEERGCRLIWPGIESEGTAALGRHPKAQQTTASWDYPLLPSGNRAA